MMTTVQKVTQSANARSNRRLRGDRPVTTDSIGGAVQLDATTTTTTTVTAETVSLSSNTQFHFTVHIHPSI